MLLSHFKVRAVATTDDPGDDLAAHRDLRRQAGARIAMIPTFRPDAAYRLLDDPSSWNTWADRVEQTSKVSIHDLDSLLGALETSYGRFSALGGRASDNGVIRLPDTVHDPPLADAAVRRARLGVPRLGRKPTP